MLSKFSLHTRYIAYMLCENARNPLTSADILLSAGERMYQADRDPSLYTTQIGGKSTWACVHACMDCTVVTGITCAECGSQFPGVKESDLILWPTGGGVLGTDVVLSIQSKHEES